MALAENERPRMDYADIAKAITIFLVIMGHCAPFTSGNPYYKIILYTFHMPLFFLISGIFVRRHQTSGYAWEHWKQFLKRNILALLVPYFIWALIFSKFDFPNLLHILYGTDASLERAGSAPSLWYLPCLFIARVLMELVLMSSKCFPKIERHLYALCFAVPAFLIAFLLPPLEMSYPWGANSAFAGLGFMLTGYAAKKCLAAFREKKLWLSLLVLAASVALFAFGIVIQGPEPEFVMFFAGSYGKPGLFFLNAFSGSAVILSLSVLLEKLWKKRPDNILRTFTLWLGRNTMGVFVLHFPIVNGLIAPALVSHFGMPVTGLGTALLASFITLLICCPIVAAIDCYFPALFGRESA